MAETMGWRFSSFFSFLLWEEGLGDRVGLSGFLNLEGWQADGRQKMGWRNGQNGLDRGKGHRTTCSDCMLTTAMCSTRHKRKQKYTVAQHTLTFYTRLLSRFWRV